MAHINYIYTREVMTPAGCLILGAYDVFLCLCDWKQRPNREQIDNRLKKHLGAEFRRCGDEFLRNPEIIFDSKEVAVLFKAEEELEEYFIGERKEFDIPLLFAGTDFQKKVWEKLREIPYGKTISYAELAKQLDCPKSVRAVANANGANAISIFTPCHRVIGSDGELTGYAGGLTTKRVLLELESGK